VSKQSVKPLKTPAKGCPVTHSLNRETIIEVRVAGLFCQVSAIDAATGIEVAVTVPAQTSKLDRETLAMRKLARALMDQGIILTTAGLNENGDDPKGTPPPKKSGLIA
jgi:hypothetical protein